MPSTATRTRRRWSLTIGALISAGLAPVTLFVAIPDAEAANTTLASDSFNRTTSSGWGQAPTGGSWTVSGGSGSSVSSGTSKVAGIKANGSFGAYLGSVSATDITLQATFTVPSATEVYFSVVGRRQGTSGYRGRARIDANRILHAEIMRYSGSTQTTLAQKTIGAVSVGQSVSIATMISGLSPVNIKSKAYVGSSVPSWQVSATDSSASRIASAGSVGVHGYIGPSNVMTTLTTQAFLAFTTSGVAAPAPTTPTPTPASSGRGAAAIGTTAYAVPSGAVFVATSGSDSAGGTQSAPVRTVTKALTKVSGGGTIVIRGGTYREYFIVPPGKNVKIQSYPNEAVWFDGSSPVTGFTQSGSTWVVGNWTTQFDFSPTYSKGAADGTADGWRFVNPSYPMAAHPDGVWINGAEQTQVSSLSQVTAGKFFVDYGTKRLYLGSNPSGKTVEASKLTQAVSLRAPGTTIRGIGFRRFADSVWMQGTINSYYANQTLENVEINDSATGGVGFFSINNTLRNVTVARSGQIGIQAHHAEGLVMDNVSVRDSNDQHFNPGPSAGGIKVTTTRGVVLKNSEILRTTGNSVWFDESSYNIDILNNTISGGDRYGILFEISSTSTIANNVITYNAYDGIAVSDSDHVSIWNNTLVGNAKSAIDVVQDTRRVTNLSLAGHDSRRPQPDMSMPWVVSGTIVGNNIETGGGATGAPILRVQSWDKTQDHTTMVVSNNGNVYSQTAAGSPTYLAILGKKSANPVNYKDLSSYKAATGRDSSSYSLFAPSPIDSSNKAVSAVSSRDSSVAQPLPSAVATKIGKAAGTKHIGAWR